jgi:hypothetical protein
MASRWRLSVDELVCKYASAGVLFFLRIVPTPSMFVVLQR